MVVSKLGSDKGGPSINDNDTISNRQTPATSILPKDVLIRNSLSQEDKSS